MRAGTFRFENTALIGVRRAQKYYVRNRSTIYLSLLVLLFVLVVTAQWILVNVPAGHVGVMWYRLGGGTDTGPPYGEGLHLILPWDRMERYDARVQQISRDFEVLTKDGMVFTVNVAWQFRIAKETVGLLHKFVGPNYVETLVVPAVSSYPRHVFSRYSTDDAYTLHRVDVQEEIRQDIVDDLKRGAGALTGSVDSPTRAVPHPQSQVAPPPQQFQARSWIELESVLIRGMQFPPEVAAAINRKMEEYQLQQEYAYRLERERLESKRKEIEAEGIARFQRTVSNGITPDYLRWRGIDATLALARSSNAKVVVIGNPRDGMPLILGGPDKPLTDAAGMAAPPAKQGQEAPRLVVPMGQGTVDSPAPPANSDTKQPDKRPRQRD